MAQMPEWERPGVPSAEYEEFVAEARRTTAMIRHDAEVEGISFSVCGTAAEYREHYLNRGPVRGSDHPDDSFLRSQVRASASGADPLQYYGEPVRVAVVVMATTGAVVGDCIIAPECWTGVALLHGLYVCEDARVTNWSRELEQVYVLDEPVSAEVLEGYRHRRLWVGLSDVLLAESLAEAREHSERVVADVLPPVAAILHRHGFVSVGGSNVSRWECVV